MEGHRPRESPAHPRSLLERGRRILFRVRLRQPHAAPRLFALCLLGSLGWCRDRVTGRSHEQPPVPLRATARSYDNRQTLSKPASGVSSAAVGLSILLATPDDDGG